MVDEEDLESSADRRTGSTPASGTSIVCLQSISQINQEVLERWLSGLKHPFRKRTSKKVLRRFKSVPLLQFVVKDYPALQQK